MGQMEATSHSMKSRSQVSKNGKPTPYLTVAERVLRGKQARAEVPRSSHADLDLPRNRPDPVELLERQATTRLAGLVPIRYGRMLVSPITFYRGGALIMAHDLANTPTSGLTVQCCGDAHLTNFGAFASAERRLVFDINDFDETLPGPWEWDVKRLCASMLIAAQDNGFGAPEQDRLVLDTPRQYHAGLTRLPGVGSVEVRYVHRDPGYVVREHARVLRAE